MLCVDQGYELDVVRGPGSLSVKVNKLRHDPENRPALGHDLWALMEQHFIYRMLLDLERVEVVDDYLVDELLHLSRSIHQHDGTLHICGLSERNQRILREGFHEEAVSCYQSSEEARADCRCVGRPK